jgi:hypothetical protein
MLNQWWYATEHDPGLPLGAIIGLAAGYGVPAGFAAYDSLTGRLIKASTVAGTSAGSNSIRSQNSDQGNSNHMPGDGRIFTRGGSGGAAPAAGNIKAGGGHSHPVSFSYTPKRAGLKLVKATDDKIAVPEGGILFGDTADLTEDDAGYSTLNDQSAFLSHETATGIKAASSSASVTARSFSHRHHDYGFTSTATGGGWASSIDGSSPYSGPSHSHSASVSISPNLKYCILKAFQRLAESKEIAERTIVLFDGAAIPQRWSLCDGTNDTIDIMDYFIKLATTSLGTKAGNNTIAGSASLQNGGSHNHYMTNTVTGWYTTYGHNNNHTHYHNASFGSIAWNPLQRTLKFIQFTG